MTSPTTNTAQRGYTHSMDDSKFVARRGADLGCGYRRIHSLGNAKLSDSAPRAPQVLAFPSPQPRRLCRAHIGGPSLLDMLPRKPPQTWVPVDGGKREGERSARRVAADGPQELGSVYPHQDGQLVRTQTVPAPPCSLSKRGNPFYRLHATPWTFSKSPTRDRANFQAKNLHWFPEPPIQGSPVLMTCSKDAVEVRRRCGGPVIGAQSLKRCCFKPLFDPSSAE
ncbi:hypothetical protein CC78DRAFT_580120 [Lojkania enalia]|uniref:Uncharacterized protein n=1 Tax=Lojkania enalia TaxID=147567 RepID=A0A9P4KA24_9PLEO|nr:hypothetical protein CC78DRAFT_580120 [Didymosphaeria enalia]